MPQVARSGRRALAIAVPTAMIAAAGVLTLAEREALGCDDPLLDRPVPMERALDAPSVSDRALARANTSSVAALDELAEEESRALYADLCGVAFYVDEATPEPLQEDRTEIAEPVTARAPLAVAPLDRTFSLQSRPGASRTVYLDFRGDEITDTAWNASYGSLSVPAYTIDGDASTAFSAAELTEIQHAWQVVAEDYAPFDVNVTTQEPSPDLLARDASTDKQYGVKVHVTAGGPIFDSCRCGGVAYVNTFNVAGRLHEYYQPAWVFTNGTGTSGKSVGEAVSHEVGHNFGLKHDGTADRGYYAGSAPWAPVMGVGYYQPVSQWSAGEYTGANEAQDDLAVIATGAPVVTDDHGGTADAATPLTRTAQGVIGTRDDVDAFRVGAAGPTRIVVTPAAAFANLDVALTVLDESGRRLAVVDPPVARASATDAGGLGATWTADVPAAGTTLTAVVDGVGSGDPRIGGGYSDYGSVGRYAITVTTQAPVTATPEPTPAPTPTPTPTPTGAPSPEPEAPPSAPPEQTTPLTLDAAGLLPAVQGEPYRADVGSVSGGTAPYAWRAEGLPQGLALTDGGAITGTPSTSGTFAPRFSVTDAAGSTASASGRLVVDAAAVVAPLTLRETGPLPPARQRVRYRARVVVDGGTAPRRWSVEGQLPRGLVLGTNRTGSVAVITGRPRVPGVWTFRLRVDDDVPQTVVGTYQIAVQQQRRKRHGGRRGAAHD